MSNQINMMMSNFGHNQNILFLSDLPEHTKEKEVETFFKSFESDIVMVQLNSNEKRFMGLSKPLTAIVIFKTHDAAQEAKRALNLCKLKGKTIRIMWHSKNNTGNYSSVGNLFVKNIPLDTRPREVYEYFEQFGEIISAKLNENEDGNHLGYGYIRFAKEEDAQKAIETANTEDKWRSKLQVKKFLKRNERDFSGKDNHKNLYVKNLPANFNLDDLNKLFEKFGKLLNFNVFTDSNGRKFAIVSFESEESANTAKNLLNGTKLNDCELYIDTLMKKGDRKKLILSKIIDKNAKLNALYRNCNLHIRNLPYNITEGTLHDLFKPFGEVRSIKIPKYILVTKENNEFIEIETSRGFAYVCFSRPEDAKKAMEDLNNTFIPNNSNSKRPLLIDFFMPYNERKQNMMNMNSQAMNPAKLPMMNPMFGQFNQNMANLPIPPTYMQAMPHQNQMYNPVVNMKASQKENQDDPDIKVLNSFEDEAAKKEYLGEFIFKKIECHPITVNDNLTIDNIGKITGMILAIDDLNEIFDICKNFDNLSARINEALELLKSQNQ